MNYFEKMLRVSMKAGGGGGRVRSAQERSRITA